MAGRLCSFSSIFTVVLIEIAVMLSFWVGDYWTPIFSKQRKPCDVTNSSIVRKLVQKNWSPVLNRYGVSLPIECPLNLSRDLLGVRESLKRTRSSHWQCLKCGKKFYLERHLDLHIERRHSDVINKAEDSVCLGQFCDVMRCDVLMSSSFLDEDSKSTDISVWTPSAEGLKKQAQTTQSPASLFLEHQKKIPVPLESHEDAKESQKTSDSLSTNCDEEYFANLRRKCADLIWECLQGLISILDAKDFKAIQSELESISCSYLSCTRYGDTCCSGQSRMKGKLRPFFIVFGSLLISLCLALAYYFVWIYTQSSEAQLFYDEAGDRHYQDITSYLQSSQPLVNRTTHL
ncbi:unnamed protein product [Allacma fusca]|uniref:C2H2-type domain-containing protein n=1 Tax=Allacma fusca TaxID=39272 RepID=A0A8J2J9G2_9HEXA|nr:unnamed protein product [Allacma fusca]